MYELTIKCSTLEELNALTAKLSGGTTHLEGEQYGKSEVLAALPDAKALNEAAAKSTRSRKGTAKPVVASNTGSASPVPAPVGANSSQGDGSVPPADTPTPEAGQATAASAGEDVMTASDVKAREADYFAGKSDPAASILAPFVDATLAAVTYTDEDIKVAMEAAAKRVDLNTLRGLLLKHGASRRSELKPENYAAFMADLKVL